MVIRSGLIVCAGVVAAAMVWGQDAPSPKPAPAVSQNPSSGDAFKSTLVPFLEANCFVCHGKDQQLGDLNLEAMNAADTFTKNRDEWDLVLEKIESGEMPPKSVPAAMMPKNGLPKPTVEARHATVEWLKAEFERLDKSTKAKAGRIGARRLNRTEYNNTIQDLLGVKMWPADDFPQDDAAFGFDNNAESLTVSPVLMEKYMTAAEKVARQAVYGPEKMPPAVKKLEQLERAVTNITVIPKEYDETGLTTDRAMHAMHRFPVDGEYLFRVTSRGFRPIGSEPLEVGLWLDGTLVTELKVDPKEEGPSLLGGRQDLFGKPQDYRMHVTAGDHWVAASVLRIYEGLPPAYKGNHPSTRPSATQPVEVALQQAEREKLAQEEAAQAAKDQAANAVAVADPAPVANPNPNPDPNANPNPNADPAQALQPPAEARGGNRGARGGRGGRRGGGGGRGGLAPIETQVGIDYVDVIGPFEQTTGPSKESIARLYPRSNMDRNDPNTPREIIANITRRAFRRPVTDAEVNRYLKLYTLVRQQGDSFEEGLAVALQGILVSPDFLFRIEKDAVVAPGMASEENIQISDHELASRLSYFLWSTMPDEELFAAADAGKLHQADVLEAQVKRMLKDPRSKALSQNFGGQWLRFRAMESVTPDFNVFPVFDEYVRISMMQETEHFVDYIVREDQSILDFLDGHYTFLNERLAMFYGIPGVKGTEFRKVDLTGTPRGGVMTQGSVLTVSSYATRTSPVLRGKWILENILNAPPPAPPNNVPPLEETIKNNPNLSTRKQLEIHRANPTCAGCHSRMDPLGMGLENFNAIGEWRDKEGAKGAEMDVDASGTLPDGRSFNGPAEMRKVLLADKEAFTECVAEKLLTYAIGRGLESYDKPTLHQIVTGTEAGDNRFSSLVIEIVKSLPFQKRSAMPGNATASASTNETATGSHP